MCSYVFYITIAEVSVAEHLQAQKRAKFASKDAREILTSQSARGKAVGEVLRHVTSPTPIATPAPTELCISNAPYFSRMRHAFAKLAIGQSLAPKNYLFTCESETLSVSLQLFAGRTKADRVKSVAANRVRREK